VDPLVLGLLHREDDVAAMEKVASDAVFSLADVGLRFYPVPSSSYAEGDERPDYLLTLRVQDLSAALEEQPARSSGASAESADGEGFDELRCSAVATLLKRRGAGPALIVGQSVGHGTAAVQEASAVLSSMREFELVSSQPYGSRSRLRSEDLDSSIRAAVSSALRELVEPIDREMAGDAGARVR
jgi:hypothetical protein